MKGWTIRWVLTVLLFSSFASPAWSSDMVRIAGGCYDMGQPSWERDALLRSEGSDWVNRYASNERHHRVCVESFRLSRTEVMVAEFRRFVAATGYRTEAERNVSEVGCYSFKSDSELDQRGSWRHLDWQSVGYPQDVNHPVVCVSWNDAQAYIGWLNEQTGQRYRLPTEAEWEYAARADTGTARYWGNDPNQACRYANVHDETSRRVNQFSWEHHRCDDGYAQTAPVGSFEPNPWGLYDMLGNVWEWTCSVFDADYGGGEQRCASANESGPRVVRGGSVDNFPHGVRSANRSRSHPDGRNGFLGLRLARSP